MSGDTPTPGVSDHIRERVAEVGVEALAGRAGCLGKACITPCQAQTLLDAYDDSAAEVERLDMLNKVETAVRVKAQAEVERLTDDASRSTALASLPSRAHRVAHVLMDFGDAFDGGPMEAVWAALPGRARDNVRGAWGQMLAEMDDAEVERLTGALTDETQALAQSIQHQQRLTRERDALKSTADIRLGAGLEASRSAIAYRERAETAEREQDMLRELVRAAQHHIPRSWPQWPAWAKRAFEVLGSEFALSGSGDYEDSTTDETDEMTVWREWAKTSMISVEEHDANRALEADEDLAATPSEPGNAEWIAWNEGGMVGPPPSGDHACECGPGARAVDGVCTACSLQVEPGGDQ